MNTAQLQQYMMSDEYISRQYGGVLASDEVPVRIKNKPKLYICNTDSRYLPGTHWLTIYVQPGGKVEYFDSLGVPVRDAFLDFVTCHGHNYYSYNSDRVQGFSDACGHYCLFFCYYRARGELFETIMNKFTSNLNANDLIVKSFYRRTV